MFRLIAVVYCVLCSLVFAESMSGRCVGVTDGDTFTLLVEGDRQEKIRLWGIDAPEGGQDFGQASKKALRSLIHNRELRVDVTGQDRYGRTIGKVYLGSDYINLRMVRSGYAWHFLKYAPNDADLAAAEQAARKDRTGLWRQGNPLAPWDWRKGQQTKTTPQATDGRFWVSGTGKVHNASCRYFGSSNKGLFTDSPQGVNCKACGGKRE